jgi:ribokinase
MISRPLPPSLHNYDHSTPNQDDPYNFEPLALRPSDWPENLIDVKAVHLAPMPLSSHLSLPSALRRKGVKLITVDPGERYMIPERKKQLKELLPLIDVILPSEQELLSLFGKKASLVDACRELTAWGAKLVIIKLGDRGTAVYEQNSDMIRSLPAYHMLGERRVVDVTGAGDAFCGAFLVGLYSTGDVGEAIRLGSVSASIVVEGYGALYALGQAGDSARLRLNHLNRVEFH